MNIEERKLEIELLEAKRRVKILEQQLDSARRYYRDLEQLIKELKDVDSNS